MPLLQPLPACDLPHPLSVSLQGRGEPPIIPSTVRAYVPLLSALILQQDVPLGQTSAEPAPLPQLSALPLQRYVPPLQPLAVHAPPPPPLSVSLQGIGVTPLLPSAVHAYARLLWQWEGVCAYRENADFCDTWKIDTIAVVIIHKPT